MTDPNLRCVVANVATLPPILDGNRISNIVTDIADIMLSTETDLTRRFNCPRNSQGWCAGPGVEAEMTAAWQQRDETKRRLRAEPHNSYLRKGGKMAGKNLQKVRKAAMLTVFWDFVRKLGTRVRQGDQIGFYNHLKTMDLEWKRDRNLTYAKYEDGIPLPGEQRGFPPNPSTSDMMFVIFQLQELARKK